MNRDPEGISHKGVLTLKHLQEMDWKHFEILCRDYYRAAGYKASLSGIGADGGVDIVLKHENPGSQKLINYIQCKAWSHQKVGVKAVRELYGVMASDSVTSGIFITASDFTRDAISFAKDKDLELISGEGLLNLIGKLSAEQQQKLTNNALQGNYTTPTCPSCDVKMVLRTSSKGKSQGQQFWGCINFPHCRQRLHIKSKFAKTKPKSINTLKSSTATIVSNSSIKNDVEISLSSLKNNQRQYLRIKSPPKQSGKLTKLLIAGGFGVVTFVLIMNMFSAIFSSFQESFISKSKVVAQQQKAPAIQQKRESVVETASITEAEINDQIVSTRKITPQTAVFKLEPVVRPTLGTSAQERLRTKDWKAKNQAWLDWYKKPWGCENWRSDEHMVNCTNHKMKAKKEFDSLWSQGKIPP
ncbi:restriction endonuclease [Endozoicomonas sp. 8E]|uniref:restriction endonuclease n=1 Tax=Endozoicomonas sp. 8E TaxID=3035692 RepID=UPI002938E9A5|nr:restriction endonuclease [Endozoicomonas sp. 8E]WOG28787.1 restriction endonuclease [Endozoicomonas sp. 8E]